jgi:putative oxidoreductase
MIENNYPYRYIFVSLSLLCLLLAGYVVYYHYPQPNAVLVIPHLFIIMSLCLAILFNLIMYRYVVTGFLFTAFFALLSARIAALGEFYQYSAVLVGALLIMLLFYKVYSSQSISKNYFSLSDSILIFLRMYVGFNFIPHFAEKLFAGGIPRMGDVQAFIHLGLPYPELFVIFAGICELVAAVSIGLGLFTRAGSLFAIVYLMIATYLGHHFSLGFIWATPGGGWEYPVVWMMLIVLIAITGANKFSLDSQLMEKYNLSKSIKWLMG